MLALLLMLAGVLAAAVAWRQARAGRLSSGHGATWVGIALVIVAAGILRAVAGESGSERGLLWMLTLLLLLLYGVGLAHAVAVSRLDERLKRLAQEIALRETSPPARDGEGD
jgi:hypothetical protein